MQGQSRLSFSRASSKVLTAGFWREQKDDITFASVHDSFWSHPSDVDILARNLRTAFVDLHSRPLLEDLRGEVC